MNYGCGSTVNPRDLVNSPKILYVGIGGGMELLQFSYFSRKKGNIIGVDIVDEMIQSCANNLIKAEEENTWFDKDFIVVRHKRFASFSSTAAVGCSFRETRPHKPG